MGARLTTDEMAKAATVNFPLYRKLDARFGFEQGTSTNAPRLQLWLLARKAGAGVNSALTTLFIFCSHVGMRRRDPHDDPAPARSRPRAGVPVPTLGQLLHAPYWVWLCCSCDHRVAVALVPFVIRWGADASSDMLRQHVRCSVCGRRGATLQHPSWGDTDTGWQPFPYP